jgi:ferredoxin
MIKITYCMPKRPKVDQEKCIGCGACVAICPDVFELGDDGKSHVKNPDACDKCDCQAAADSCPVGAITLE